MAETPEEVARDVLLEADASAAQVLWLLPYLAPALRAQYVAGLERAMHEVVSALNRGRAEKASGAALTVLTALEINLRELAEQAKREGTTP